MKTPHHPYRLFGAAMALACIVVVLFVVLRHRQVLEAGKGPPDDEGVAGPAQSGSIPSPATIALRLKAISDSRRLEAIERNVAELQAKGASSGPAGHPPDPEEGFKKNQEEFAAAIAKHRSDPIDEVWARKTAASLQEALEKIGGKDQFALLGVDCRKESCLATIEWESYGRAVATYGDVVTHPYDVSCGTGMILSVPRDPAARYRADAIFNCRSQ